MKRAKFGYNRRSLDKIEFTPEFVQGITDNKVLINKLVEIYRANSYNQGYVYLMYVKLAKYYSFKDLEHIQKLFNYKRYWVTAKFNELKRSEKWRVE